MSTPLWGLSTPPEGVRRMNRRVPLATLFVLEQAPEFGLHRLGEAEAVGRLLGTEKVATERAESAAAWLAAVDLPEWADVIVSDLRGVLPLFQHIVPAMVDARRRLLAGGGALIPRRDTLWSAVVEAPEAYRELVDVPWVDNPYGLDMSAARRLMVNRWRVTQVRPEQLLAPAVAWFALHYETVTDPNIRATVTWEVARPGLGHGLAVWFDAEVADGVSFSNAPGGPDLIYGRAFFPWPAPVALAPGDRVAVELAANLPRGDYVWRWNSLVTAGGDEAVVKADFRQSTAFGTPIALDRVHKGEAHYVPRLASAGQVDRMVLELMDGQTALADIAARVQAAFPGQFRDENAALTRVADLSAKYA